MSAPAGGTDARSLGSRSAPAPDGEERAGDGGAGTLPARLRAAEERIAVLERRLQGTVERVTDGILVVDPEGSVRFANPAAERIFGRAASELLGSHLGFPLAAGEMTEIDLRVPGGTRTAELRVVDTYWDDGDALLVSIRDITERRQAEEQARQLLHEQTARLQAENAAERARLLARASRALSASVDPDRILETAARLAAEYVGDRGMVVVDGGAGRPARVVAAASPGGPVEVTERGEGGGCPATAPGARRVQEERRTERVTAPGPEWIEEVAGDADARAFWERVRPASAVLAPLLTPSGSQGLLTAISRDPARPLDAADEALLGELADRAGLALEHARLLRRAQEGSRAKSDFLSVVSHELRTPLAGITGYAGLLLEGLERPLTEQETRYVEGIQHCADRLLSILDQILLFARSRSAEDEVKRTVVALPDLIEDVLTVVRPLAADAGLELDVRQPEGPACITTDRHMLHHILLHLLVNAIKFTDEGRVGLRAESREDGVVLRVTDTGRGIPAEKLGDIFEPFRQADDPATRVVGGTGIGLNVVQNLVRALGGEMDVESRPGYGSTFTVRLPRWEEGDRTAPPSPGRPGLA